jgi:hypothetical protein
MGQGDPEFPLDTFTQSRSGFIFLAGLDENLSPEFTAPAAILNGLVAIDNQPGPWLSDAQNSDRLHGVKLQEHPSGSKGDFFDIIS